MKILKFGGTSVGSAERMRALAGLISDGAPKIVVLSAMSGTTDTLTEIAAAAHAGERTKTEALIYALGLKYANVATELYDTENTRGKAKQLIYSHFGRLRALTTGIFTAKEEHEVLAQGELLTSTLFQYHLEERNITSVLLPALDFMRVDLNGEPDMRYIETNAARELAKYPANNLFITQGYICRNASGETANLKRDGSDYTATILGAAIGAEEIQIWTDINGMQNNDPRVVENTRTVSELSFDEAAELAYFGAKILHPMCILPAREKNIPVRLLNIMQPEANGTLITGRSTGDSIKAVAAKDGITAIKIKPAGTLLAYSFLRAVFEVFERNKTRIDMITTSTMAVSLTIDDRTNLNVIILELKKLCSVEIDDDFTIICVAGYLTTKKQGYVPKILESLKNVPIRMISYGGSENNIYVLIKTALKQEALKALNGLF